MARILITTLGSYGDLYPYLEVGKQVRKLRHEVTIATSETYRAKVQNEGLGFAPIRPSMSLEDREMMKYLFDQRRGSQRVVEAIAGVVRETYEDTLPVASAHDAILTQPISLGGVLVAQKLKLPWISTVLAPIMFMSAYDPPLPAPLPPLAKLRVFGPGFMRAVWDIGKRASLPWIKPVLELRREIGLPPGGHPMFEGSHSPDLVLALFSGIFGVRQPDWPAQTVITGFPFHDAEETSLVPQLEEFLSNAPPPIVFTLGSSAVGAAGDFYRYSLQAVERLGVPAVFLTGSHPQDLPPVLPSTVLAWPYAPHNLLFARSSVIVHQGGVGTTAQALRSGRPMLVVPFAHDQFDNADRVRRLGAGLWLARGKYNAGTAEKLLRKLLEDRSYALAASQAGEQIAAEHGGVVAARAIDRFVRDRRR